MRRNFFKNSTFTIFSLHWRSVLFLLLNLFVNICISTFLLILLVYFHEFKEMILESLIVLSNFVMRFLNEDSAQPFFWIVKKIESIAKKSQEDGVNQKLSLFYIAFN